MSPTVSRFNFLIVFARKRSTHLIISALLLSVSLGGISGCSSRLKLHLFCETPSGRTETRIEEAFYVENYTVGDPLQRSFLVAGEGSLAAIKLNLPDTSAYNNLAKQGGIITFKPALGMRMYWPLPPAPAKGDKGENRGAFVDLIGNNEITPAKRILQLASGGLEIDSVRSSKLYVSIHATFRSLSGDSLRFDGNVRLSKRKSLKFQDTNYQLSGR